MQYTLLQPKIRPVNCSCWGGNFFIQDPALELVVLEEQERQISPVWTSMLRVLWVYSWHDIIFLSFRKEVPTLNISNRVSFFTSSLSKGCFSLMIFLHKFSKKGKSLLDTPLKTDRWGREMIDKVKYTKVPRFHYKT